jgi:thiol-disulfide isomerase/thioredoxin
MKFRVIFFILSIALLNSCENSKVDLNAISNLDITLSKARIIDDNSDAAIVTVKDQNGNVVTEITDIYISGAEAASPEIKSEVTGVLEISARYNEIVSNSINLEVVEDPKLKYKKSVLIEQFTGTWCGYCPRAISAISDVLITDREVTHIAYHLDDQMSYSHNPTLFQYFGFTGVPSMMADRKKVWLGNRSVITSLHTPVYAGISLTVTGNSDKVHIDVESTFGILYTEALKVTVYILEDHLVYDQSSYYNDDPSSPWYQMGNTLMNLHHNGVMIQTVTELYGDVIPSGSIDINSSYAVRYSLDSPNVSDINNLKAIVFITYGSGSKIGEVINSLTCSLGQSAHSTLIDGD